MSTSKKDSHYQTCICISDSSPETSFTGQSPIGIEDSKWEAAISLIEFLGKLSKLLDSFKASYTWTESYFPLIKSLSETHSEVLQIQQIASNSTEKPAKSSIKIEIINVAVVEETASNSDDAAARKMVAIMKKLASFDRKTITNYKKNENITKKPLNSGIYN